SRSSVDTNTEWRVSAGHSENYRIAFQFWTNYATRHNLPTTIPTRDQLLHFLEFYFYEGCAPDQIRQIRAAVNSYTRSHGLIPPDDTTWQRAVQGYISLWNQGNPLPHPTSLAFLPHGLLRSWMQQDFSTGVYLPVEPRKPPTTPDKPRISATWLAQVLDATGLPANWRALIAVFWLSRARRDTNRTVACNSFTFIPASHTLLIDLKKKRGERSQVAKLITRPLDCITYAFLERHLPDACRSSDSLQAPATALNNLTDE
ncbi:hypothetical protein SARC_15287, partial [Sphaeroforma arctica JP610]